MHILIVTHRFLRYSIGGTESLANSVALNLISKGHYVTWLAVGQQQNPGKTQIRERDDGLVELEVPPGLRPSYPVGWREQERAVSGNINKVLRKLGRPVDVVHVFHFARLGLDFLSLPHLAGKRLFFTLTDYFPICPSSQLYRHNQEVICNTGPYGETCRRCCSLQGNAHEIDTWRKRNLSLINKRANGVFTQTPFQFKKLVAAGLKRNLVRKRTAAYPTPPLPTPVQTLPSAGAFFRFGFLGRLSREKGLSIVLRGFESLHRSTGCRLYVYGVDDNDSRALRTEAQKCPGTTLRPPVPFGQLGAVLQHLDCLIIPSLWWENHPSILSQSIDHGVPVIMAHHPSLKHLEDLDGVRFVRPGDTRAWISEMARAIRDNHRLPKKVSEAEKRFDEFVNLMETQYRQPIH